jgi:hypothetical protein
MAKRKASELPDPDPKTIQFRNPDIKRSFEGSGADGLVNIDMSPIAAKYRPMGYKVKLSPVSDGDGHASKEGTITQRFDIAFDTSRRFGLRAEGGRSMRFKRNIFSDEPAARYYTLISDKKFISDVPFVEFEPRPWYWLTIRWANQKIEYAPQSLEDIIDTLDIAVKNATAIAAYIPAYDELRGTTTK